MFDPEKVRREEVWQIINQGRIVVDEADYDQLLELYREAKAGREAFAKAIQRAFPIQGPSLLP